ncbi:MAG: response regulator [Ichthyobacteriaceae bacterium]|nr:response regulator [Ichthyobacteriaceae bacterium]
MLQSIIGNYSSLVYIGIIPIILSLLIDSINRKGTIANAYSFSLINIIIIIALGFVVQLNNNTDTILMASSISDFIFKLTQSIYILIFAKLYGISNAKFFKIFFIVILSSTLAYLFTLFYAPNILYTNHEFNATIKEFTEASISKSVYFNMGWLAKLYTSLLFIVFVAITFLTGYRVFKTKKNTKFNIIGIVLVMASFFYEMLNLGFNFFSVSNNHYYFSLIFGTIISSFFLFTDKRVNKLFPKTYLDFTNQIKNMSYWQLYSITSLVVIVVIEVLAFLLIGVKKGIFTYDICLFSYLSPYFVSPIFLLLFITILRPLEISINNLHNSKLQLLKTKEKVEYANNSKNNFLNNISHEIRTPINGILGLSQLINLDTDNEIDKKYSKIIHKNGNSLLNIVNDVLDLSKIENQDIKLHKNSFNLKSAIERSINLYTGMALKKQIEIILTIDKNVDEVIRTDETRYLQILNNLLSNAIKYSNKGTIKVEVSKENTDNGYIKVITKVIDEGIGITEYNLTRIFDNYYQTQSNAEQNSTGLGLSISKNLSITLGGELTVSSVPKQGSTFSYSILSNQNKVIIKHNFNNKNKQVLNANFANSNPMEILVVEDNKINQMLIMKILNRLGYNPKLANNGIEAVDMSKEKHYDLIFMDLQMPIMDGLKASNIISKRNNANTINNTTTNKANTVIVALTANVWAEVKEQCFNNGMKLYISKPYKFEHITDVIIKVKNKNFNNIIKQ